MLLKTHGYLYRYDAWHLSSSWTGLSVFLQASRELKVLPIYRILYGGKISGNPNVKFHANTVIVIGQLNQALLIFVEFIKKRKVWYYLDRRRHPTD